MLTEIEKFFVAFIGEDIYTEYGTAIKALIIGFCLLLVYGLLVRPLLNLCLVKNKSFFDIIMTVLIIIVSVKIAFPGLFTVDGFTQDDLDNYYDSGYSDGYDLGESEGYDKGYADAVAELNPDTPDVPYPEITNRYDTLDDFIAAVSDEELVTYVLDTDTGRVALSPFYCDVANVKIEDTNTLVVTEMDGYAYAVVDDVLWYRFEDSVMSFDNTYVITSCNLIAVQE